ncbi:hypothetical protein KUCAC02_006220, partial [Chaenocephalus aceratus]
LRPNKPLYHSPENSRQTVLKDQHSILLRWAEHFGTLLNQDSDADPTVLDDLPTLPPMHNLDQPPTFLEVQSAIRFLKNNKSPGNDNIPAELLKQGGYLCTRALHKYITEVWADEIVPQQWRDANVVTIYKNKGDEAVCGNSRGISLLAVAASFRYLGSILSEDNIIDNEVQNRIKQSSEISLSKFSVEYRCLSSARRTLSITIGHRRRPKSNASGIQPARNEQVSGALSALRQVHHPQ